MDDLKKELQAKNFPSDPEHCVIHAMFPPQLEAHLKGTNQPKAVAKPADTPQTAPTPSAASEATQPTGGSQRKYGLTINGKRVEVEVEEV